MGWFNRELLVVCSAGGHLTEALAAIEKVDVDTRIVTKRDPHASGRLSKYKTSYLNDPHTSIWGYIVNAIRSLFLVLRERPRIVLSTGAGIAIPTCLLAKMMGSKLIYVETGARISTPSKTGKFLYKYADKFYIQWRPLQEHYPDAIYGGPML